MRDRSNPSFFEALAADPHLQLNEHERQIYIEDMNRPLARLMLPIVRFLLMIGIYIVRFSKRYIPFPLRFHGALNRLGVWFMRDLVSPQALEYIIRHFQLESALINFVADNCGSESVKNVDLMPTHVSQLGDVNGTNAIVQHDINIFNHIIDTGSHPEINVTERIPLAGLNFSALDLPTIRHEPNRKRLVNLDIETACYVMVFFLVLFLTDEEGERAALSLQFDESLMKSLSNLTGDDYFLSLCPLKFTHLLRYHIDVVQDLRFHMITMDYAYNRLCNLQENHTSLLVNDHSKSSEEQFHLHNPL